MPGTATPPPVRVCSRQATPPVSVEPKISIGAWPRTAPISRATRSRVHRAALDKQDQRQSADAERELVHGGIDFGYIDGPAQEGGQAVMQARAANPDMLIIARAHSEEEVLHLKKHGASTVIMGASEIARALIEDLRKAG